MQVPPMYSAIKKRGKKLYELARAGQDIERDARPVSVHSITLLDWDFPQFTVQVECSSGMYIRSLAHDIGQAIGTGGHLSALRRTRSGAFDVNATVTLKTLGAALAEGSWQQYILPVEMAISDLPRLDLDAKQSKIVEHGGFLPRKSSIAHLVRAYDETGQFFALLEAHPRLPDKWKPRKVFR